jgi:phosphopantothenoylcysteine decarboxylase/phosphopantothenate--cysteine ligase
VEQLRADGVTVLEPDEGEMACGEYGPGRLPEPEAIVRAIESCLAVQAQPAGMLKGKHIIVTAGPTHEPMDPVRMLANRSSGKQGFAIAQALAARGARVTLIAGPVSLPTPAGVERMNVQTALEMQAALRTALPSDAAVMVAAVADWRAEASPAKIKKSASGPPELTLVENPDLLAELASSPARPRLLIGFAAETEAVIENARAKLARKGCDWIVANDVSGDVMGGEANQVHLVTTAGVESWERLSKAEVAARLADRIAALLGDDDAEQRH